MFVNLLLYIWVSSDFLECLSAGCLMCSAVEPKRVYRFQSNFVGGHILVISRIDLQTTCKCEKNNARK